MYTFEILFNNFLLLKEVNFIIWVFIFAFSMPYLSTQFYYKYLDTNTYTIENKMIYIIITRIGN